MKKSVKLLLLIICVFCLTGCGNDESDIDFKNDTDLQQDLLTEVKDFQTTILQLSDEEMQVYLESEEDEDEVMANAISSWNDITDIGEYESGDFNTMSANLKTSSAEYTCTLHFTDRDVEMVVTFEDVDGEVEITDVSYNVVYSLGEKMSEAGLNTLMGICIVFVMLIFISFIISLFAYIPKIVSFFESRKAEKTDKQIITETAESTENEFKNTISTDVSDDSELIAVISAAIAASENTSGDSFVVRSIRRRETNKWHKA